MAKKTEKKTAKKKPKKSQNIRITELKEINFDYIKSNHFRVIHVNGAHGGIGPRENMIQMALFSERQAIPQRETYDLKNGALAKLKKKEARDAIIREVEVEAILDLDTAIALKSWLANKIETIEKINKQVKAK